MLGVAITREEFVGFLSSIFERRALPLNDPATIRLLLGSSGGAAVSTANALQLSTVFACARVLSGAIMMLPLKVRQALPGGGSRPAVELPIYWLLDELANPEMTAAEVRQTCTGHLTLWGNAYLQKVYSQAGQVVELWPLRPDRMAPMRGPDGKRIYEYTQANGERVTFVDWEIMHLRTLSPDGLIGYSPIGAARRTFEISVQMEQYQESFYRNGARPGGVLKYPGKLKPEAYAKLLESWQKRHGGAESANRVAILEEGMSFEDIGIPQSDAEFLASKKYTDRQICALMRVPSSMVNDTEAAAYASREQASLDFVIYSCGELLTIWEKGAARDLLTADQRRTFYIKHTLQALLRGDNASRSQFYSTALQNGWLSINEVRALEDMNPIPNGDTLFVPLNMVPLDQAVQGQPDATTIPAARAIVDSLHAEGCTCGAHNERRALTTQNGFESRANEEEDLRQSRVEMARAMVPILEDIATRTVRREVRDVRRLVDRHLRKRSAPDFRDALGAFYAEFGGVVADNHKAALLSYARQAMSAAAAELGEKTKGLTDDLRAFVMDYLATMGAAWSGSARTQLEIVLDEAIANGLDAAELVEERLSRWEETKPTKTAARGAFEALNAFVLVSYGAYGITRYRWVASGESCPFCRQLSGRSAGLEEYILQPGAELEGGDGGPMRISRNVRHGPLHGGCDCVVRAER